jgi:hypothetical protein
VWRLCVALIDMFIIISEESSHVIGFVSPVDGSVVFEDDKDKHSEVYGGFFSGEEGVE